MGEESRRRGESQKVGRMLSGGGVTLGMGTDTILTAGEEVRGRSAESRGVGS